MAKNGQRYRQNGDQRNSGSLGQTLPPPDDHVPGEIGVPAAEAMQSPEGDIVPFSLEEFASLAAGVAQPADGQAEGGQFGSDDLEFEPFMFNSGHLDGIRLLEHTTDAVAETSITPPLEIAQPVDADSLQGAVLETPLEANATLIAPEQDTPISDAMMAALSNIGELVSNEPEIAATPGQYPTSVADWSDQMLASIDDFSVVLMALRTGKLVKTEYGAALVPTVPTVSTDATMNAPETSLAFADTSTPTEQAPLDEVAQASVEDIQQVAPVDIEDVVSPLMVEEASAQEATFDIRGAQMVAETAMPIHDEDELVHYRADSQPDASGVSNLMQEHPVSQEVVAEAQLAQSPVSDDMLVPSEMADWSDNDLPPWLKEDAAGDAGTGFVDTASQDVQTFDSLSGGTWLGDLVSQGSEPVALTEGAAALEAVADEVVMQANVTQEATAQETLDYQAVEIESSQDSGLEESEIVLNVAALPINLPDIPESGLTGDAMEFESFMFNQGVASNLPALPSISAIIPSVQSMEASIEVDNAVSPVESPMALGSIQLDAATAQTEAVEEDGEDLPFWLQTDASLSAGILDSNNSDDHLEEVIQPPVGLQDLAPIPVESTQVEYLLEDIEDAMLASSLPTLESIEASDIPALVVAESDALEPELMAEASIFTDTVAPEAGIEAQPVAITPAGGSEALADMSTPVVKALEDAKDEVLEGAYNFENLPPIEPFDFSIVPAPEVEETLGFSTEELTGGASSAHEPMMTTANLDVLADLLGKERTSGVLDLRGVNQGAQQPVQPAAYAETSGGPTLVAMSMPNDTLTSSIDNDTLTSGWLTETDDIGTSVNITGLISQDPTTITDVLAKVAEQEDTIISDFEVAPFDITELELDAEEIATGYLNTGLLDWSQSDLPDKIFTGTLFTQPDIEKKPQWEAPDWMDSAGKSGKAASAQSTPQGVDPDTALFRRGVDERETGSNMAGTGWMGTGLLPASEINSEASSASIPEMPVSHQDAGNVKARVTRFRMDPPDLGNTDSVDIANHSDGATAHLGAAAQMGAEALQSGTPQWMESFRQEPGVQAAISAPQPHPETAPAGPPVPVAVARMTGPMDSGYLGELQPAFQAVQAASVANDPIPASAPAPAPAPQPIPMQSQPLLSMSGPPPEMSIPATTTSGPLFRIDALEGLREIVAKKPGDLGAHMALAVAYAQSGHSDHAMYEYHRLLQQPNIPMSMLQLISDQVADMESHAGQSARFYQLRGDLLMRLGRYEEAIGEYNKIR